MAAGANDPAETAGDGETYVGRDGEDAQARARAQGWNPVRALGPDAVITMEYMPGRLNLIVEDGWVTRCWIG